MAVLPTGLGKSLPFQLYLPVKIAQRQQLWEGYSMLSTRFTYARSSEQAYFSWVGHSSFQRYV